MLPGRLFLPVSCLGPCPCPCSCYCDCHCFLARCVLLFFPLPLLLLPLPPPLPLPRLYPHHVVSSDLYKEPLCLLLRCNAVPFSGCGFKVHSLLHSSGTPRAYAHFDLHCCPELYGDLDYASYSETQWQLPNARVFVGGVQTVTAYHYDHFHNINAQIWGRKKWTLVCPAQSDRMCISSKYSLGATLSSVTKDATEQVMQSIVESAGCRVGEAGLAHTSPKKCCCAQPSLAMPHDEPQPPSLPDPAPMPVDLSGKGGIPAP